MKPEILEKIEALKKKAKNSNKNVVHVNNGKEMSLSKVIKTKEEGDLFMKRLKAL